MVMKMVSVKRGAPWKCVCYAGYGASAGGSGECAGGADGDGSQGEYEVGFTNYD